MAQHQPANVDAKVQAFVQRCQDQGFDPATAFVFYQELNAVGAPLVINEALANDDDRRGFAMMNRFRAALAEVNSPADWKGYCDNWTSLALDQPREAITLDLKKDFMRSVPRLWSPWVAQESSMDVRDRLITMGSSQGLERYREAAQGMTWERLAQVVQADRMPMLDGPTVTRPGDDDAPANPSALQAALQATSVRSVRWNWIDGDTEVQHAQMAQGLHRGQAELQARTAWSGPVLGLNGQMRLSFGNEHAFSGYAQPTHDGSTLIVTSPKAAWGVVSHEWFHAFDQIVAREMGTTDGACLSDEWKASTPMEPRGTLPQQKTIKAFNTLLHTLMVEEPGPAVREEGLNTAIEKWQQRMLVLRPWAAQTLAIEQQRLDDGTWTREASLETWVAGFLDQGEEPEDARPRAELMVSEVEFLRTAHAKNKPGASVWRDYLDHFNNNLIQHHRDQGQPSDYEGYFQQPAEALAHSFESTFASQDTSITDVHAGQTSLQYPTTAEGRWQAQAWRAFFENVAPHWRAIAGLNEPEVVVSTDPVPHAKTGIKLLNGASLGDRVDQWQGAAKNADHVTMVARQPRAPGSSCS